MNLAEANQPTLTPEQIERNVIVAGRSHPALAADTVASMGLSLGEMEYKTFGNGDLWSHFPMSIRGMHLFIVQTGGSRPGWSVNDTVVETLMMVDNAVRASAKTITLVFGQFPYDRQDYKDEGRVPISVAQICRMYKKAEVTRLAAVRLHSPQSQGHFYGPFDTFEAWPILREVVKEEITDPAEYLLIAPDYGTLKRVQEEAEDLGIDFAFMPKSGGKDSRENNGSRNITRGFQVDVDGRHCLISDDRIATGTTMITAAEDLLNRGALDVMAYAVHGEFVGESAKKIVESGVFKKIIVTDTLPQGEHKEVFGDTLQVERMGPLIGWGLLEIITEGSVSRIFQHGES